VSAEGRERRRLVPQSATRFSGSGLVYDFVIENLLQEVIQLLRASDFGLELQFTNYPHVLNRRLHQYAQPTVNEKKVRLV